MYRHSLQNTAEIATVACALWLLSCHDSPRSNPFDPNLTPAVELQSVEVDSTRGTATLTWTQYSGDQSFTAYQVSRRVAGTTTDSIRATITDITDTTFHDPAVDVGRAYIYTIDVVNAAGLVIPSNAAEGLLTFRAPELAPVEMSAETATATLRWSRAASGFARYQIQRQAENESGPLNRGLLTVCSVPQAPFV